MRGQNHIKSHFLYTYIRSY